MTVGSTSQTASALPVEHGVDVAERRRDAAQVAGRELVEVSCSKFGRCPASRRLSATERRSAVFVVELLEPHGLAAAVQRVGAKSQMRQLTEYRRQTTVHARQTIAVEPEVDERPVERQQRGR